MRSDVWRPIVLAASCLVLGFVGGWSIATLGGDDVALPEARLDVTVREPAPSTSTVGATTAAAAEAPDRGEVVVSVLNGTARNGFAASTAQELRGAGYANVTTGDTPARDGPTIVYYRRDFQAAAERLAQDLQAQEVAPLAGTPLEAGTPGATQLVVVLGA